MGYDVDALSLGLGFDATGQLSRTLLDRAARRNGGGDDLAFPPAESVLDAVPIVNGRQKGTSKL